MGSHDSTKTPIPYTPKSAKFPQLCIGHNAHGSRVDYVGLMAQMRYFACPGLNRDP